MKSAADSNDNCLICNDWNLLAVEYLPHEQYSENMLINDDENLCLKAKTITFETMKNACKVIFENIYTYKWTKDNMKRYCQVECVTHSIAELIYQHTVSIRPKSKKDVVEPINVQLPNTLLPAGLKQNVVPLNACIVGVMHTLVLNLGKHVLLTIRDYLKNMKV